VVEFAVVEDFTLDVFAVFFDLKNTESKGVK
jgi:hypothetical protein